MKEVDLFEPVKHYLLEELDCTEVYGEVLGCDVLGIHGALDIVVELKKNLSFKLLDQAIDRLHLAHYLYIAIPKRKRFIPRIAEKILKEHRIGLIEIEKIWDGKLVANVEIPAKFNRTPLIRAKKLDGDFNPLRKHIRTYHKQKGGVPSGKAKTDYSVMIDNIRIFMRIKKRWVTIDEILQYCETYYANPKPSLSSTLRKEWNQDWCETKRIDGVLHFRYRNKEGEP